MTDYWKDLGIRLRQSKRLRFNYIMDKINSISSSDITELASDVETIQTAIGDEETADSILGRIKALEDAATDDSKDE